MRRILPALLSLLLLLSACGAAEDPAPPAPGLQPPALENTPPAPVDPPAASGLSLDRLTVELVVDWEAADALLIELDDLSLLLKEALSAQGCEMEEITVTISTAGGFTAGALADGGVDLALLPTVDYASGELEAYALLTTTDEPCTGVAAVTAAREELDGDFRSLLARALLDTDQGQTFLALYSPGIPYETASEEAIDAVRAQLGADENRQGGM